MGTQQRARRNGGQHADASSGDASYGIQQQYADERGGGSQPGAGGGGDDALATFLGWFSIGLGVAQVVAPRQVARFIGVNDDERSITLMRAVGVRELAAGAGILSRQRPAGWLWARVAGDAMDLALLGSALRSDDNEKSRVGGATAAVLGVAALDVLSATRNTGARAGKKNGARGAISVRKAITVNRPPEEVYAFWHDFENLPRFMTHLESVRVLGGGRSHWEAKGPAGTTVEWDAEVVEDRPNELIAWRSLPDADVDNSGSVRFSPAPGGRGTQLLVELEYRPPAGAVGKAVAKLFGEEPTQQVTDDLRRFKQVIETGEILLSDGSPAGIDTKRLLTQRPAQPPAQRPAPPPAYREPPPPADARP